MAQRSSDGDGRRSRPLPLDDRAVAAVVGGASRPAADRLTGSGADEVIDPRFWDRALNADGGAGADTIAGTAFSDQLTGGTGADDLAGKDGHDVIWGDNSSGTQPGGADSIYGGHGEDTVFAGGGNDLVVGGDGNDMIFGDAGADTLVGSTGVDRVYGGEGDDVFLWQPGEGADLLYAGEGMDTLRLEGTGLDLAALLGSIRHDATGTAAGPNPSIVTAPDGTSHIDLRGLTGVTVNVNGTILTLDGFERLQVAAQPKSYYDR